jgi:hypothetical protein
MNASVLMNPAITYQYEGLVTGTELLPLQPPKGIENLWENWYSSTVVADNLAGVGESTVYIGDFSKIILYGWDQFELVLKERNAEKDQSIYMLIVRYDMNMIDPAHMVRITGLRKGANIT